MVYGVNKGINMKLLGVFKKAYGNGQISVETEKKEKLKAVIKRVAEASPEFRRLLIDPELNDPLPNAVILVNGKEISALRGLETEVGNGDEIVLIPVIHGG
ncbi:MAG: MoaD/ThiS family protein [Candidatus Bathyarchaeota archaeon]|nr:MoaD/ThiS family protein [Candidatus Bathyarchaeota archaeon]